jgi:acetylornithine deacetylase/succinyl-diaminopimelate desuccinylase-like protein
MPGDDAIRHYLEDRQEVILEFARDLIRCPSVNPPGDERAVADLVVDRLRNLGVDDVRILSGNELRPNVIARVPGAGHGPSLILSGHLDTKPAGDIDSWQTDPWDPILDEDRLVGLGSGDMKAAIAGMVYAAGAIREAGCAGDLLLVFTADEEAGSVWGSRWLAAEGHLRADAAIIGEPSGITSEWEAIDLVSRGAALFKIQIRGTQMHSSVSDRFQPVNATVKMARLIDRMDREMKGRLTYGGHPLGGLGPTVNVGVMASAGVYYGIYPGNAEFACDIRTLPGMTRAQVEADLREFLDDAMADDADLEAVLVMDAWVDATEIDPSQTVVEALLAGAEAALGSRPRLDAFPGATDAPHFQLVAGIPTVAAVGPGMLQRAHSPNEWLDRSGPYKAALVYGLAASRFLDGDAGESRKAGTG